MTMPHTSPPQPVTRQDVLNEAASWLGTPYTHQASCKGAGCDCLGFIRGVFRAFWQENETLPAYSANWAEEGGQELMFEAALRHLVPRSFEAKAPGDVLLFRYRPHFPAKHAGILLNERQFIHAQHGAGVVVASLGPWWQRRIAHVFAFPALGD